MNEYRHSHSPQGENAMTAITVPLSIVKTRVPALVRRADVSDTDEVMQMAREVHQEIGLFKFSESKVRSQLQMAFDRKGAVIGVIGNKGRLEGSIYLLISDFWYTEDWHLGELWNYVRPEYRKSDNAQDLISFSKRCADELKLPAVLGIVSNEKTQAKVRLYERKLGTAVGAFFVYIPAGVSCRWNGYAPTQVAVEARLAAE